MTGITIDIEIDDAAIQARLTELLARMEHPHGFYKNVGEHMLNSTRANFEREAGPDGTPWARLRAATIRARERKGQVPIQILRATSRLAASINYMATDSEARWGSPMPYAAIHQLGGTINRSARTGKIYRKRDETGQLGRRFVSKQEATDITEVGIGAHTITMPARPFLGMSAADQQAVIGIAEDWLGD